MPIYLNAKDEKKLRGKRNPKLGKPIRPPRKSEIEFRAKMTELWARVLLPASARIRQLIKDDAPLSQIALEIENTLRYANQEYEMYSKFLVDKWKMSVDEHTRQKMQEALRQAIGIDLTVVLEAPEVKAVLDQSVKDAVSLISTIPGQHLGKIAQAVADNFAGRPLPEGRSLLQQIQEVGRVSKNRAKLIARDQTSKLTGKLVEVRQTSIGIEEYIWRTSMDGRVVGNPTGLYPEGGDAHEDHFHRNGKKFRWDSPPPDGHPGAAIQCRCHAQPIIDPQKIATLARRQ